MEGHQEADPKMEAQERVQDFFLKKIAEANTPEELLSVFGAASAAAEFAGIEEPSYRHPDSGAAEPLSYLYASAKGYLAAAQQGNEDRMNSLGDVGLPPEFKQKVRDLVAAEQTPEG